MKYMSMDEIMEILPAILSAGRPMQVSMLDGVAYWKLKGDRHWRLVSGYELSTMLRARCDMFWPPGDQGQECLTTIIVNGRKLKFSMLRGAIELYAKKHPGPKVVIRQHETDESATASFPGELTHEY